jgi:archaellum component FlaC
MVTNDMEGRLMARINAAQEAILERIRGIEERMGGAEEELKAADRAFRNGGKAFDAITEAIECIHRRLLELEEG